MRFVSLISVSLSLVLFGCGASRDTADDLGSGTDSGGGLNFDADDPFDVGEGGPPPPCTGLACERASCPAGVACGSPYGCGGVCNGTCPSGQTCAGGRCACTPSTWN